MNVLVIGSGGREHAIAWKLSQSQTIEKIYVWPGNAGMKNRPKIEVISKKIDFEEIALYCEDRDVKFVFIGPEAPLVAGIVDFLEARGIPCIGPGQRAARLEGSKVFSKKFMAKYHIPTADFQYFTESRLALEALQKINVSRDGVVIKSDALAAGKGVVVTHSLEEAQKVVVDFMDNPDCSVKTEKILFEKLLSGREVSAFALCDGESFVPLGVACDYKRAFDQNQGPNTGGMGCVTPEAWPEKHHFEQIDDIFHKVLHGMNKENHPYTGILFVGLMIEGKKVSVIEFNIRLGDPETQTLLPVFNGDLGKIFFDATQGELRKWKGHDFKSTRKAVHVVMASGGYPSIDRTPLEIGYPITIEGDLSEATVIFYAGVKQSEGTLLNNGGRVLGVTSVARSVGEAAALAYEEVRKIHFQGAHFRRDIGTVYE